MGTTQTSFETQSRIQRRIDDLTLHAKRMDLRGEAPPIVAPLLDRFVVAVGGDPHTDLALAWARELAPLFAKHVTLAHVETPMVDLYYADVYGAYFPPGGSEEREREGLRRLELARNALGPFSDVDVAQPKGSPVDEIAKLAREGDADLVVVGSPPHPGLERWLLKSTADGLKDHAPCSVLLAKTEPRPGDVLCAVDGSWSSKRAAALAHRLSRAWGSTLHVLHALRAPPASEERLKAYAEAARSRLGLPWSDVEGVEFHFRVGDAARIITDESAQRRPALVVMGSRGLSGLRSLVAGSVTTRVAHHVDTSMIIVK